MSRHIDLSPRLRMVADLIPEDGQLVDVGTDHAYLPVALIQEGKIPSAIAADLRQGPLSRAKATVQACGLNGRITFRLCDGLSGIRAEEADVVAIAGMGGETIANILAASPWTKEAGKTLVLQPMSSHGDLRRWLWTNEYTIQRESLAQEGDVLYTALLVTGGRMASLTPAECLAGCNSRLSLRGLWLDRWIEKTKRALEGIQRARQPKAQARSLELEELLAGLQKMKKEWEAWQR
jgi:tRNA A22 N-methylase